MPANKELQQLRDKIHAMPLADLQQLTEHVYVSLYATSYGRDAGGDDFATFDPCKELSECTSMDVADDLRAYGLDAD